MTYNREEQLEALGIWQEEAAEVIQELSKVRRTGPDFCRRNGSETNMEHLQNEVMDFMILMEICEEVGIYTPPSEAVKKSYREFKLNKLNNWSGLVFAIQGIQGKNPS